MSGVSSAEEAHHHARSSAPQNIQASFPKTATSVPEVSETVHRSCAHLSRLVVATNSDPPRAQCTPDWPHQQFADKYVTSTHCYGEQRFHNHRERVLVSLLMVQAFSSSLQRHFISYVNVDTLITSITSAL